MNTTELHQKLFGWWQKEGRVLPWREKLQAKTVAPELSPELSFRENAFQTYFASSLQRDPYKVVVAELMLQQTQVDRVLPKYRAWMDQWPQIEDLAQATLAEVLIFWQGLGYNRRARFLWLMAKEIVENRGGIWPTTEIELRALPGIGKYTARAVQSFALGQQVGVVDTNVKRILQRVFDFDANFDTKEKAKSELEYFTLADQILPLNQADPWNQALMDFGALICTARAPKCEVCPINNLCHANLIAQKNGYKNFAEYIDKNSSINKKSNVKKSPKFTDTNRFFRGRIMDVLRNGPQELQHLAERLQKDYGLTDTERFQKLIDSLKKEGLIKLERDPKNFTEFVSLA